MVYACSRSTIKQLDPAYAEPLITVADTTGLNFSTALRRKVAVVGETDPWSTVETCRRSALSTGSQAPPYQHAITMGPRTLSITTTLTLCHAVGNEQRFENSP